MKYICLVYHEEAVLSALSQSEFDSVIEECGAWVEELERGGHHVFSAGLQSTKTSATLRSRRGELSVTDGPFAETKEFLGGFTILEARDLNEAIQLASKLPAIRFGTVEVRPVLEPDADLVDPTDQRVAAAIRRVTKDAVHS